MLMPKENTNVVRPSIKQCALGFSMVEVLVALVVLSVGMLGIASLYVITLRSGSSAISRTQAISLAADMGDRIRANRNRGSLDVHNYDTGSASPANRNCVGGAVNCTPQQIADEDIFTWRQQITTALPGNPTGTIVRAGANAPFTYTITINWAEPSEPALNQVLVVTI